MTEEMKQLMEASMHKVMLFVLLMVILVTLSHLLVYKSSVFRHFKKPAKEFLASLLSLVSLLFLGHFFFTHVF